MLLLINNNILTSEHPRTTYTGDPRQSAPCCPPHGGPGGKLYHPHYSSHPSSPFTTPLPLAPPPSDPCREVSSSERPLLIQRRWEANGQKAFELKVKPSIPLQVRSNGLLCALRVSLHKMWFMHTAHVICLVVQRNFCG